eukprot:2236179-Amphidinium_carterae.1
MCLRFLKCVGGNITSTRKSASSRLGGTRGQTPCAYYEFLEQNMAVVVQRQVIDAGSEERTLGTAYLYSRQKWEAC